MRQTTENISMVSQVYKRTKIKYTPTGPTVRAALDLATKTSCFIGFGSNYHGLSANEMQRIAIELFMDKKVLSATLSKVSPKTETARQLFTITFTPLSHGYSPTVEIDIKSLDNLRAQAKRYPSDSTAYSVVRKPKSVNREARWNKPGGPI